MEPFETLNQLKKETYKNFDIYVLPEDEHEKLNILNKLMYDFPIEYLDDVSHIFIDVVSTIYEYQIYKMDTWRSYTVNNDVPPYYYYIFYPSFEDGFVLFRRNIDTMKNEGNYRYPILHNYHRKKILKYL